MIPIWNDLWFPLILAPSERNKTVTLGAQSFLGQYVNDWNAVLASLTLVRDSGDHPVHPLFAPAHSWADSGRGEITLKYHAGSIPESVLS